MKHISLIWRWEALLIGLFILGCVGCSGGKQTVTDTSGVGNNVLLSQAKKGKQTRKGKRKNRRKQGGPSPSDCSPLELVLSTDKSVYRQGETVQLSFTIRNPSDETVALRFSRQYWPEYVVLQDGKEVWRWSRHVNAGGWAENGVFAPKFEMTYPPVSWNQRADRLVHDENLQLDYYVEGDPVPLGTYQVKAVLPADPPGPFTSNVVEIQITP